MIITSLEINNFGPYNGRHSIDLGIAPQASIVLIHGENERGKTSLANAIRWCLYGRARGRGGRDLTSLSLMNYEALDASVFNMTVKLAFDHDGHKFRLTRHVQSERRPTADRDLEPILTLERDGTVLPTEQFRDVVSGILPFSISRFFLFDGEMLSEYEDLLNDPERAPSLVRSSIEEILGLPALQRGERDLEELRVQAERKQLQEAKKKRENERLVRDAAQKEEALNSTKADIAKNLEHRQRLEDNKAELRARRERFSEIHAELKLLDQFEGEVEETEREAGEARRVCKELLREAWWMPLEDRIERDLSQAETRDNEDRARARDAALLRARQVALRALLENGSCDQCGQSVNEARIAALRQTLDDLNRKADLLGTENPSVAANRGRVAQLREFGGRGLLRQLHSAESSVLRQVMRTTRIQRKIAEIRQNIRDHDRKEVQQVERSYDDCLVQLEQVTRLLQTLEQSRNALHNSLERLRQDIRRLPGADRRLADEAGLLLALETVFERGIDAFKEEVRKDVEEQATLIHKSLTSEPEYEGLRITEHYGLTLVNREGRTIRSRAAGAEQIIALSLIGALNRCATREAPVVMDTPFGRLDRVHRANVMRFAPTFGRQVVLLVQSGEFDSARDRVHLEGRIAREYHIVRDGASDRSRFEPAHI
jgi:DNA sulfur modification protein DndD